jgi:hypothetical protein
MVVMRTLQINERSCSKTIWKELTERRVPSRRAWLRLVSVDFEAGRSWREQPATASFDAGQLSRRGLRVRRGCDLAHRISNRLPPPPAAEL